jgi:glutathione synthase/RimK-type ligase-like ATP-grasp enzyme
MTILVISYPEEEHTDAVVTQLIDAGRHVERLDMAELPAAAGIIMRWRNEVAPSFELLRAGAAPVDLAAVKVTWWRRVRPHTIHPALGDGEMRAFAESETTQAIGGLFDALRCRWVNPRSADESAHRKPYQWTVAQQVGLRVPETLVTTDPIAARRFIEMAAPGRVVFKPFLATTQSWRETRIIGPQDLDRLDLVRYAPVIFQHYIDGVDLRVTVIGEKIFAAEIDARGTIYPFDMRMVIGEAKVSAIELPKNAQHMLLMLQRRLNLDYGAIDLRRTDAGEYYFLEVNPAGQWLFVEQRTNLPITRAMADYLSQLEDSQP